MCKEMNDRWYFGCLEEIKRKKEIEICLDLWKFYNYNQLYNISN